MRLWTLLLVLLSAGLAETAAAETDIWAAAREGDIERVKALLESGVDVNVKTRFNITPLFFAAENGHTELIDFLVEKGATLGDRDLFFQHTPLAVAVLGKHAEAAVRLIEHGAVDNTYMVLASSVRQGLPSVAGAIVRQGPLLDFEKNTALATARQSNADELVALIEEAEVRTELPTVELDAPALERLVGLYRDREGVVVNVRLQEGALTMQTGDDEPMKLAALSSFHFRSPSNHELGAYFTGRLGIVEQLAHVNGSDFAQYRPFEPDTTEPVTHTPPAEVETTVTARKAPVNWPSFRGANGSGVGDGQGVPTTWNVETGENVLWKKAIPGLAHSSPVVWGDRVFVTTAISDAKEPKSQETGETAVNENDDTARHTWKTLAFDKATGEVVWQHDAGSAVPLAGRHATSSQANSTPTTDGERVVVVFPTAGMVCYDMDGNVLWKKDLGALNAAYYVDASMHWGFASSPVLDDGKVILQADVYEGAFLAAYDAKTGRELWKTPRDELVSWSTPLVYRDSEHQEIVTNGPTIRGYDLKTGRELWTLRPNSEQVVPTPITAHGLIYVTTGYPPAFPIYAVRPGHRGDLSLADGATSSDAIAWSHARGGSYMVTPIVYDGLLYLPANGGRLTTYDAVTGERIYRARLSEGGNFTGSPVAADGRLYLPTADGTVYVIKAGRKYEEVALIDMQEGLTASPAISDGVLFIRTRSHLYALGSKSRE